MQRPLVLRVKRKRTEDAAPVLVLGDGRSVKRERLEDILGGLRVQDGGGDEGKGAGGSEGGGVVGGAVGGCPAAAPGGRFVFRHLGTISAGDAKDPTAAAVAAASLVKKMGTLRRPSKRGSKGGRRPGAAASDPSAEGGSRARGERHLALNRVRRKAQLQSRRRKLGQIQECAATDPMNAFFQVLDVGAATKPTETAGAIGTASDADGAVGMPRPAAEKRKRAPGESREATVEDGDDVAAPPHLQGSGAACAPAPDDKAAGPAAGVAKHVPTASTLPGEGGAAASRITCNGHAMVRQPVRLVNPLDRELDKVIWRLFAERDPRSPSAAAASIDLVDVVGRGANVNYQRAMADGTTALMAAARLGHLHLVRRLMAFGNVRLELADRYGNTAVEHARAGGHTEVVSILHHASSGVGPTGTKGGSSFHGSGGGHGTETAACGAQDSEHGHADTPLVCAGAASVLDQAAAPRGAVTAPGMAGAVAGAAEDDYVYDMYVVRADQLDAALRSNPDRFGAEVLRLQSEYAHALRACDTDLDDDRIHVGGDSDDSSAYDYEDEDSNAEDHYLNEYPDEESSGGIASDGAEGGDSEGGCDPGEWGGYGDEGGGGGSWESEDEEAKMRGAF